MTRTAKYLTKIRTAPDRAAPVVCRTRPGVGYEILSTRLVRGEFWMEIAEGWVVRESRGVKTFREPVKI